MKYIFIFFLLVKIVLAYTNIAPLYFDEKIDGDGGYKEYILTNNTQRTLKYRIYAEKKENDLDMTSWTEIYPKVISLKPGQREKVKVFIQAPKSTNNGEYITNFCIKEIEYPNSETRQKLQVFTNLKIELAGFVGENLGKVKMSKVGLDEISIENIGYKREKLSIYFVKENNEVILVDSIRVFKGETKTIKNKIFKDEVGKIRIVDKNENILLETGIN